MLDDLMSEHRAIVRWKQAGNPFAKGRFSREHSWSFDGGLTVPASSSPAVVPAPMSNPANIDPEEAFVASLSSCHMLTFLFLAYRDGLEVASYEDEAVGVITKNERGASWVSTVVLNPRVVYEGAKTPTRADEERLHHAAHEGCFISNSVKTEVQVKLAP
jgi:organic hydroperoxide reductase OsmC/OhrA